MLLEVGRIDKAHGLAGEVIVSLVTNRAERLAAGTVLATDRGPLTVRSATAHHHRYIVAFDGISGRTAAESWRGVVLRAEAFDDPDEMWVHDLIGARVIDQHGVDHGAVAAVIDNPASDLLELTDGRLVPLVFVTSVDPGVAVVVEVPPGLLSG